MKKRQEPWKAPNNSFYLYSDESNKRKALLSHALDPLGKLPDINHNDMERDAYLLG
jgi:hypothetical protein